MELSVVSRDKENSPLPPLNVAGGPLQDVLAQSCLEIEPSRLRPGTLEQGVKTPELVHGKVTPIETPYNQHGDDVSPSIRRKLGGTDAIKV